MYLAASVWITPSGKDLQCVARIVGDRSHPRRHVGDYGFPSVAEFDCLLHQGHKRLQHIVIGTTRTYSHGKHGIDISAMIYIFIFNSPQRGSMDVRHRVYNM